MYDPAQFEIIIHRAHNLHAPENSLSGIDEIRELSSDFMIEVDVCLTADNVPVLYHDLSLDRLCNDPRIIDDVKYTDLPERKDHESIARLDTLLSNYPEQKFLLDLRTHIHPDFLQDSTVQLECLTPPLERITDVVKEILSPEDAGRIRLVVGNPSHRDHVMHLIPGFEVDIPEQFLREHLKSIAENDDASFLGEKMRRIYIRYREVTPEIITWAHSVDLKIVANHSPSLRSVENSQMMLEKAIEWGMDGLTASPIDQKFINTWAGS